MGNLEKYIIQLRDYTQQEFDAGYVNLNPDFGRQQPDYCVCHSIYDRGNGGCLFYRQSYDCQTHSYDHPGTAGHHPVNTEQNADLSRRITKRSKDETGVLTSGINQFLEILENLIRNIRGSSQQIAGQQQAVYSLVEKTEEDAGIPPARWSSWRPGWKR